jgi:hypothetical protein
VRGATSQRTTLESSLLGHVAGSGVIDANLGAVWRDVLVEVAPDRPGAGLRLGWSTARCSHRPGAVDVSTLGLSLLVEVARDRPGADMRRDWSAARCSRPPGTVAVPKPGHAVQVEVALGRPSARRVEVGLPHVVVIRPARLLC